VPPTSPVLHDNAGPSTSPVLHDNAEPSTSPVLHDNVGPSTSDEIIREIVTTPKISTKRTRTRKCEKATHLTTTPSKTFIENKTQSRKVKESKKKLRASASCICLKNFDDNQSSENDECPCIVCGEPYSNSRSREKWIRCMACSKWAHQECTEGIVGCIYVTTVIAHRINDEKYTFFH